MLFISFKGDLLLLPSADSSFLTFLTAGEGDLLLLLTSTEGNLFTFLPVGDDDCFLSSISGEPFLVGTRDWGEGVRLLPFWRRLGD